MRDMTYSDAIAKAEHLKALGQTTVYLYDKADDFPFDKVTRVESGNGYRLGGPNGCYLIAEVQGLTFKFNVDFEPPSANGSSTAMFDRDAMRALMFKLPATARKSFAEMLAEKVLPPLVERTNEYRKMMQMQADSEDCVRGLIAFAEAEPAS